MYINQRSPLWGAIKINITIILLLATITSLFIFNNYQYRKLQQVNNELNIVINNKTNEIAVLENHNNELNNSVNELKEMIEKPSNISVITSEEREMIARLVYLEANTESIECQRAVVSVVMNRLESGYWGKTIKEVIYAPGQFSPASLIKHTTPRKINYEAVDYVINNGITIPKYILYFSAGKFFSWKGYCAYTKIDNTCFGYMKKDKR